MEIRNVFAVFCFLAHSIGPPVSIRSCRLTIGPSGKAYWKTTAGILNPGKRSADEPIDDELGWTTIAYLADVRLAIGKTERKES